MVGGVFNYAEVAKDLYYFTGASVREEISHKNTGGGGKSRRKGTGVLAGAGGMDVRQV